MYQNIHAVSISWESTGKRRNTECKNETFRELLTSLLVKQFIEERLLLK